MAEIRITLPWVTFTDKELVDMVSSGIVCKPDDTKITLDDLKKIGIPVVETGRSTHETR